MATQVLEIRWTPINANRIQRCEICAGKVPPIPTLPGAPLFSRRFVMNNAGANRVVNYCAEHAVEVMNAVEWRVLGLEKYKEHVAGESQ